MKKVFLHVNALNTVFAFFLIIFSIGCSNRAETELQMQGQKYQENGNTTLTNFEPSIQNRQTSMVRKKEKCCCCFYNLGDCLFCWFACPCWCCVRVCCDDEGNFYKK